MSEGYKELNYLYLSFININEYKDSGAIANGNYFGAIIDKSLIMCYIR